MKNSDIFALADDLTGALEVGAKFASYGMPATVTTRFDEPDRDALLVVDAQTRHLSPQHAAKQTEQVAAIAQHREAKLIYKKTDSTLRGNIAAEFRALQNVYPNRRIMYAPAYPDLGRTVKHGRLYVHGKPVHETEFAGDLWNPVHDCRVQALLGDADVEIVDGDCNSDVCAAADLILAESPPRICAGPAALADALARKLGSRGMAAHQLPRGLRCLVVNGSLHPASVRQVEWARNNGMFTNGWMLFEEAVEGAGVTRARMLGECVRRALDTQQFDGVIVFGGDTTFGVHAALGFAPFQAIGEVAPGVAISKSSDLFWITKAGGFGDPEILGTIKQKLT